LFFPSEEVSGFGFRVAGFELRVLSWELQRGTGGGSCVKRTLVIGFGNVYRRDDGVGFAVLNALRERLGRSPLGVDEDGYDSLQSHDEVDTLLLHQPVPSSGSGDPERAKSRAESHEVDTLLLHQLVPELAGDIAAYDLVVFVDAHVGHVPELIYEEGLTACYKPAIVSHTLHPCTLLAMVQEIFGRQPQGVLLSIRGYDFEFGEGLSDRTAALVPEAVERIWALVTEGE
jgi:Ni,Fe-hydrogenase maturation factor